VYRTEPIPHRDASPLVPGDGKVTVPHRFTHCRLLPSGRYTCSEDGFPFRLLGARHSSVGAIQLEGRTRDTSPPRSLGTFMLDSSNVAVTSMALGIGVAGAAVIEVLWWAQGAFTGERRRLWR
jgi:hypothetical protein